MAYRAPELFDVKTGITLDEKVDIWVRLLRYLFAVSTGSFMNAVTWLHALCAGLLSLTFREHANNGAGWFDSHGRHGRTVQAPSFRLLPRPPGPHRQHVEG